MQVRKNWKKSALLGVKGAVVLAASMLLQPAVVSAEGGDGDQSGREFPFRYGAQFTCGTPEKNAGGQLVQGKYATQINLQNYHGKKKKLRKKVALTYPPRMEKNGKTSDWIYEKLKPNHAMSVDCEEIMGSGKFDSEFFEDGLPTLGNGNAPTFITGYLIIQSSDSINVTTVHTAGPKPEKEGKRPQVHSIAVTNVPEHLGAQDGVVAP